MTAAAHESVSTKQNVRERPILFSGAMVRAIVADEKTQTRRVIKPIPRLIRVDEPPDVPERTEHWTIPNRCDGTWINPFGQRGDRLWVRETFMGPDHIGDGDQGVVGFGLLYQADNQFRRFGSCGCEGRCGGVRIEHPWKPSIHMRREYSRITIEITDVGVQRIQNITREDAIAEGCPGWAAQDHLTMEWDGEYPEQEYERLWNNLNAKRGFGWDANPWVWVLSFNRITP